MVQKNILRAIALLLFFHFGAYGVQQELICAPQIGADTMTSEVNEFPVSSWLFCNEGQFVLAYGFPTKLTPEICYTSVISFMRLGDINSYEKVSTYESVAFLGSEEGCNMIDIWEYSELNEMTVSVDKQAVIAVNNWLKHISEASKRRSGSLLKFSLWNRFFDAQTKKFIGALNKDEKLGVSTITPYFRSKEKNEYLLDVTNKFGAWTVKLKIQQSSVISAQISEVIN